jgi:hypothetical protein
MKTSYRYHVLFPLNILVGYLRTKLQNIRGLLHFWSVVLGVDSLLKEVDKEIEKESID